MEKKIIFWFLILLFVLLWFLVVGQVGHSAIFGEINLIDEGQYAAWVYQMLNGKMIYRDIYVQYGPLMVFPIYLLMKFFGETIFFVYLWSSIGAFLGYVLGMLTLRQLKVEKSVFIISLTTLLIVPGINIRQWIGVLIFILLSRSYETKSLLLALLTGVFMVVAFLQSVEIGLFTFLICAFYIGFRFIKSKKLEDEFITSLFILLGTVLSFVSFFAIFQSQGWLSSYIYSTKEVAVSISGMNLPNGKGLPVILQNVDTSSPFLFAKLIFSKNALFYLSLLLLLIFLPFFIIRLSQKNNHERDILGLLITIFAILIYFSIVGRSGHYISVFPFVVILLAYFVSESKGHKLFKKHRLMLYSIFLTIFCMYILRHIAIYRFSLVPKFNELANTPVSRIYPHIISFVQSKDILELKNFFELNRKCNDFIYILNNAPGLYFLLEIKNPTRYDLPLLAGVIEKRQEIVNDLIKHKPLCVLEDMTSWAVDEVSDEERMPEVFKYVKRNYQPYKRIGHFLIYRLVDDKKRK